MEWSAAHGGYTDPEAPDPQRGRRTGGRSLALRAVLYLFVFAALQFSWEAQRGTTIERIVIHNGSVQPAAVLVNMLTPGVHAQAVGFTLRAPGGGLNILNGCEGTEMLFLLLAAFLVAPLAWSSRFLGMLLGVAVVFLTNLARILVLFYAYRADPALFDQLHATVMPIAAVLVVFAYFYAWLAHDSETLSR